jgi:hypothetical protein
VGRAADTPGQGSSVKHHHEVYTTRLEREKSPKSLAGYTFASSPNRPFPTVVGTPRRIRTSNGGRVVSTAKADHPKIRQRNRSETRGGRFRHRGTCPAISTIRAQVPIGGGRDKLHRRKVKPRGLPCNPKSGQCPFRLLLLRAESPGSSPAYGQDRVRLE